MLLGIRRYQLGSDGGSWIVHASRIPSNVTRLAAMREAGSCMLLGTRRYQVGSDESIRITDVLGTQKLSIGMHGCFFYSIAKRGQRRRSPGARKDRCETITNIILRYLILY